MSYIWERERDGRGETAAAMVVVLSDGNELFVLLYLFSSFECAYNRWEINSKYWRILIVNLIENEKKKKNIFLFSHSVQTDLTKWNARWTTQKKNENYFSFSLWCFFSSTQFRTGPMMMMMMMMMMIIMVAVVVMVVVVVEVDSSVKMKQQTKTLY